MPVTRNEFIQQKRLRRAKAEAENAQIADELREVVAKLAEVAKRHGAAATMVRLYQDVGGKTVASANLFRAAKSKTGPTVGGHQLAPTVEFRERVVL